MPQDPSGSSNRGPQSPSTTGECLRHAGRHWTELLLGSPCRGHRAVAHLQCGGIPKEKRQYQGLPKDLPDHRGPPVVWLPQLPAGVPPSCWTTGGCDRRVRPEVDMVASNTRLEEVSPTEDGVENTSRISVKTVDHHRPRNYFTVNIILMPTTLTLVVLDTTTSTAYNQRGTRT
jgi:hypothetical protein